MQSQRARLVAAAHDAWRRRAARLEALSARLAALDPQAVLARGYALALDAEGRAVTTASRLSVGAALHLVLASGSADAQVTAVQPGEEPR
jgi:exodeoxyribonuclease VII large subunit